MYIRRGVTKHIYTYTLRDKKEVRMVEVYPKYIIHMYKIIRYIRYISSIKRTPMMVFEYCLNYVCLILTYKKNNYISILNLQSVDLM